MRTIYLDNNATTMMNGEAKAEMIKWVNTGNPSSDYKAAQIAANMIKSFKEMIKKGCNAEDCDVVFTSGGSEANCTIIQMVANAFIGTVPPHIISSAYEHKSVLECLKTLQEQRRCTYTLIKPTSSGGIDSRDVARAITSNTRLITIMHANNETGVINDIAAISKEGHAQGIIVHTDAVQSFGKSPFNVRANGVDAVSVSFHKCHGPPGCGALILKSAVRRRFGLKGIVSGSQNDGLRGGTENIPGLAASRVGLIYTWTDRSKKNVRMFELKKKLIDLLGRCFVTATFQQYKTGNSDPRTKMVLISGQKGFLPNTLMISCVGRSDVCNSSIKRDLAKLGIIISIGSACNTSSPYASHVLDAIGADSAIKRGALRISIGDETTEEDIVALVTALKKIHK